MFTLIRGGEVYTPQPAGVVDVLVVGETIWQVGDVGTRGARRARKDRPGL